MSSSWPLLSFGAHCPMGQFVVVGIVCVCWEGTHLISLARALFLLVGKSVEVAGCMVWLGAGEVT